MVSRKRRAFVEEYLRCWNGSEAARRAGYSERSANVRAHRLLQDPDVQAQIEQRVAELKVTTDEMLLRLAEQARGDLGAFFKISERWTEEPLPTQEIVEETVEKDADGLPRRLYLVRQVVLDTERLVDPRYSHLVKRFGDSPRNGLTIELYDGQNALQLIGKHLGMFTEQVKHSGSVEMRQGPDLSVLNDDELAQLEKILAGAYARAGQGGEGAPASG